MTEVFTMRLDEIQPSQLFISSEKLSQVMRDFAPITPDTLPPIPVKELRGKTVLTDGHTRALAALLSNLSEVSVFWDEDDMDWEAYEICVDWCEEEGIRTIAYLRDRIVPPANYEELWLNRCAEMHRQLEAGRG
ncbi:MAG: hypothetical protein ACNA7X_01035 [Dehalococcoidia bacterium]